MTAPRDKSRSQARDERERVAAERLVAVSLIMWIVCSAVIVGGGILFGWVASSLTHSYLTVPAHPVCTVRI